MKQPTLLKAIYFIFASLLLSHCDEPYPEGACPACPTINSLEPDNGRGGDEIIIRGKNFENFIEGIDKVTVNNVEALLTAPPSDEALNIQIPALAGTGPVVVFIGELSSSEVQEPPVFTFNQVRLDSISPTLARMGETITLFGDYFHPDPEQNEVIFVSDAVGEVVNVTDQELTVVVPPNAQTGKISVKVLDAISEGPEFTYIPTATVSTCAGTEGSSGYKDGLPGIGTLSYPFSILSDDGILWITENSNGLRRIDEQGKISTPELSWEKDIILFRDIAKNEKGIILTESGENQIVQILPEINGSLPAVQFNAFPSLNEPRGIAVDSTGNIFIADKFNHQIILMDEFYNASLYAGNGNSGTINGQALAAEFSYPHALTFDIKGNLLVSEATGSFTHIRMIDSEGIVSTLTGGSNGLVDGPLDVAEFHEIRGMVLASSGDIFIADTFNHRIRMITTNGFVVTIAGSGSQLEGGGMANGTGLEAKFNLPTDLTIDDDGIIFISDGGNNLVRKITLQ